MDICDGKMVSISLTSDLNSSCCNVKADNLFLLKEKKNRKKVFFGGGGLLLSNLILFIS